QELYRAMLRLRREDPVLSVQPNDGTSAEAVSKDVLYVRRKHEHAERLLVANFGAEPHRVAEHNWRPLLSSDDNTSETDVRARSAVMFAREQ
ncbi:MAG TPA: DUF3459 domain-containing protein, partial [Chloroflexota bacterium]|nr:DUF3459 domain-containing protein [Chloroflexota bacterium]